MMHQANTIMLQGTASGVGKSTLAAGLCRLFCRKGYQTAPFKAQNLSDNVHLLADGRRMARSQVIAAAACKIEPSPDMNPVLLCPSENGCQVIVNGLVTERFDRDSCRTAVHRAYERLCECFDVVVAEGAGSPVELNLTRNDIVNMDFAKRAGCPVILVSDIYRGGVFASLYGTMQLFSEEERALVKGIIVNNFCGDPSCFEDGRRILEALCGVPVLGVVPHMELHLEDEDSLPGENTVTQEKLSKILPCGMSAEAFQDQQFDLLANQLEKSLDLEKLQKIMEGVV